MNDVSLQKLTILSLEKSSNAVPVVAQFNPRELSLDRTASWGKHANDGQANSQQLEFTGQEGRSLAFELLFDCSEMDAESITKFKVGLANLEKLASVQDPDSAEPEKRRPHQCAVIWGDFMVEGKGSGVSIAFKGVIESLSIKYTMFAPSGIPIRATANLKFKEAQGVSLAKPSTTPAAPSQGGATTPPSRT